MNQHDFDTKVVPALGDALGFVPEEITFWHDTVRIQTANVTFETLSTLSEAFGTREINVRTERQSSGGCDTCNFYFDMGFITVEEITKWPGVL